MTHDYAIRVIWTGNAGRGTETYTAYGRDHEIVAPHKTAIKGSADAQFRGDATRWNPEELLVAALAACHKLWYLHLCADAGVCVESYEDDATGHVAPGRGEDRFIEVWLRPRVVIRDPDRIPAATSLHDDAHRRCFIARSVAFPVRCAPTVTAVPVG